MAKKEPKSKVEPLRLEPLDLPEPKQVSSEPTQLELVQARLVSVVAGLELVHKQFQDKLSQIETIQVGLHQILHETHTQRTGLGEILTGYQEEKELTKRLQLEVEGLILSLRIAFSDIRTETDTTKGMGFFSFLWKLRSARARVGLRRLLAFLIGIGSNPPALPPA